MLARLCEDDRRTVMGKTLCNLLHECNLGQDQLDLLTPVLVKQYCRYFPTPEDEIWKVGIVLEMLAICEKEMFLQNLGQEEIIYILDHLCVD